MAGTGVLHEDELGTSSQLMVQDLRCTADEQAAGLYNSKIADA